MPRLEYPAPPEWAAQITTVGVTGTNGKSTTTTWVAAALGALSDPVACVTTLGFFLGQERQPLDNHFGSFLKLMRLCRDRGGRAAAIELTSQALADGFAKAWPCRVGVFTNLSRDHLQVHGSFEHYLASKAQLFVHLEPGGAAVLNAADPNHALLAEVVPPGVTVLTYAFETSADLQASNVRLGWDGSRFDLRGSDRLPGCPAEMHIKAIGHVFVENALAALAGCVAVGVPIGEAVRRIVGAPAPRGRFEVVHERPWVVVDYAHTPDAIGRTVGAAKQICDGRLTVVFGAGGDCDHEKRPDMGRAARRADRVVITSDNPRSEDPAAIARAVAKGLGGHTDVETVLDRKEAIARALSRAEGEDVVLVLGKGHEERQLISGRAIPFSDQEVVSGLLDNRAPDDVT